MKLKNKNILFISASFFNYEKAVISRMLEMGATVDFFDERPSNSGFTKGIIRVYPKLIQKKIDDWYESILRHTDKKKYDYFLLIKGESIPFSFLEEFKKRHLETTTVFYSYDTVKEYPRMLKLFPYFDRKFSFEPADVLNYGFKLRPLFYLNDYLKTDQKSDFKYDLVFVGSAHTDRYRIGEEVRSILNNQKRKSYFFYYSPGKLFFYLKRIFDKNMKSFDVSKLSFEKLSHHQIAEIYKETFSVLDINKPFQFGISMRTFETLASGRKLMTTNPEIKFYPFYNPNNVLIIDREKIEIPNQFFETGFEPTGHEFKQRLSVENWIESLFLNENDDYWESVMTDYKKSNP
ncbi:MAG: hypothetical protein WBA59_01215 [Moheibacter sp.]